MAKESHEGLETPGVGRRNQKTRMATSFRKAKLNTCHFFLLTFWSFFPSSIPKSNLSDAAYLLAKVTLCGLSSRSSGCCHCACWIRARVRARILDSCINLPRPPMSSAKVQKKIMQMTICCVLFGVFFFLLCKSELSCTCMELVWHQRFVCVCQARKWDLVENNTVCLSRQ